MEVPEMNHLNFKLPSIIGIALVCTGILACQIPGMAREVNQAHARRYRP